ncbi:ATP-binding protein [Brevundimonas basaltis]|uniref:histidine kinase n=1 Tax=Brevundimonas basaltis TaxID=472166 RepID=A0A7W8HW71_9CAUL|nr:two-component system sensor histidine kinase KdpD [Brevundimonas basaltis]
MSPSPPPPRPTAWFLERFDVGMGVAGEFLAAATVVLIGTVTAAFFYEVFDLTRLAIFFLGSVIVCALFFGTRPAVFAAFLAFIAYNFALVEPYFSFRFAGADDALTLAAFLVVALLVGGLAGRVRESERSSRRRADLLESLLGASRAFSAAGEAGALRDELAAQLELATDGQAFILTGGTVEDPADEMVTELAAEAVGRGGLVARGAWRAKALSREGELGVAVWRIGETPASDLAAQNRLCGLLVDLGAAALDRIRLVDLQTEIEAGVRASRLRDAILGSISHDLRTPLATVLASASSLRDYGERFSDDTRRDLAEGIVQEADRLNSYLESLLALSRIEAGHLAPALGPVAVIEVLDGAIRRLDPEAADRVDASALDQTLEMEADAALLEQVVFNLLDNAVVHGGPSVRVRIEARRGEGTVELSIEDDGVGVPDEEYDHLCDKFYRGQNRHPDARGTGVGLSIAKGFIEAMGGSIRLGRSRAAAQGLRVDISLRGAEHGGS